MNTITENHRHRRSIRLREYDYSSEGLYFITICVHERRSLFGTIVDGVMHLNAAGRMVEDEYHRLPEKYSHITCHEYVVMPNHFHCIIQIHPQPSTVGAGSARPETSTETPTSTETSTHAPTDPLMNAMRMETGGPTPPLREPTLGQIMGYFKYQTTKRVNLLTRLWQRNYYEHIIRDQRAYEKIAEYIIENPMRWTDDVLHTP